MQGGRTKLALTVNIKTSCQDPFKQHLHHLLMPPYCCNMEGAAAVCAPDVYISTSVQQQLNNLCVPLLSCLQQG
jgi:hypothetical protein